MACTGHILVDSTTALHEASREKVAKGLTGIVRASLNSGHIRYEDVAQTSGWCISPSKVENDGQKHTY